MYNKSVKKTILVLALILLVSSVFFGSLRYVEKVNQGCGEPTISTKRINWFWQWWPNRDDDKAFLQCVGPSEYISYRPIDIAVLGILISIVLLKIVWKREN